MSLYAAKAGLDSILCGRGLDPHSLLRRQRFMQLFVRLFFML